MELLDLATATHETFAPFVGQTFQVSLPTGPSKSVPLEMTGVREMGEPWPGGKRRPFALDFRGLPGVRLPQGIHRFQNAAETAFEIFIVQLADGPQGSEFEAVFA